MGGIQFVVDAKGQKTAAVIDLKVHKALWEDIEDVLMSRSRSRENGVPLAKVKTALVASGKLRGQVFGRAEAECAERVGAVAGEGG